MRDFPSRDEIKIIMDAKGNLPRIHGNGFLQFNLNDSDRIHVWSKEIPRQVQETQIHNHTFSFVSKVWHGSIRNILYDSWNDDTIQPEYKAYRAEKNGGENTCLIYSGGHPFHLYPKATLDIHAGRSYRQAHSMWHETLATSDLAVTLMTKTYRLGGFAQVACNRRWTPDNDFNRHAFDNDYLIDLLMASCEYVWRNIELGKI